jgi:hypothetical protein
MQPGERRGDGILHRFVRRQHRRRQQPRWPPHPEYRIRRQDLRTARFEPREEPPGEAARRLVGQQVDAVRLNPRGQVSDCVQRQVQDARRVDARLGRQTLLVLAQDARNLLALVRIAQPHLGNVRSGDPGQAKRPHGGCDRLPQAAPLCQSGESAVAGQHAVHCRVDERDLVELVEHAQPLRGEGGCDEFLGEPQRRGHLEPDPRHAMHRQRTQQFASDASPPAYDQLALEGMRGGRSRQRSQRMRQRGQRCVRYLRLDSDDSCSVTVGELLQYNRRIRQCEWRVATPAGRRGNGRSRRRYR